MRRVLLCLATFALLGNLLALPHASARVQTNLRHISGEKADPSDYPWRVKVRMKNFIHTFECEGVLIAPRWVLTAARCATNETKVGYNGEWDNSAEKVFWSDDYHLDKAPPVGELARGVALLQLKTPINATPVALADENTVIAPGQSLETIGDSMASPLLGPGSEERKQSEFTKVRLPYVSNETCNAPKVYNGKVLPSMMCAGRWYWGIDACQGSHGAGVIFRNPQGVVLVGIVPLEGDGCERKLRYGIYTRVSAYRKWIDRVIAANNISD
jgi:secreted trypsin-like serine protease